MSRHAGLLAGSGLGASVEAAYRVGSTVVEELLKKWPVYRDQMPPLPK